MSNMYKCKLYSITPSIYVNPNLSRRENIVNASTEPVMDLIVKRTLKPGYFREVLTDRLIPVYYECMKRRPKVIYSLPNVPCFIYYFETENGFTGLVPTVTGDLEKYSRKHFSKETGYDKFALELDDYFAKAEGYYEAAINNDDLSGQKKLIRKIESRK